MAAQDTLTRDWQGLQIPPAGTYDIDPSHTTVEVIARHMIVAKVRGRFEEFSGRIEVADDPSASTVEVDIEAGSINTAEEQRDAHLRSPDFLDVEGWPRIVFRGHDPEHVDGDRFRLAADLTVRDVTKPVDVRFTLEGVGKDPWGNTRAIFSANFTINREEFGMTWNQALETGGVLVGKDLVAEIECQAVLQQ
jgi:polyisoprenoid-binding protein YceI